MGGIPQGLIECIGKAQRHQILHRFLAKVMVDTECLLFGKGPTDRVVEGACGRQVTANGFFNHDTGIPVDQIMAADALADVTEQ